MQKFKDLFVSSTKELKNVRCITLMAMLAAISIVIGFTLTFMPAQFVKISFTFLPNEFVYYLFGPFVGIFFGAAIDILNFMIKPMGPYFPGFTLSSILIGLIYGVLLYKKPLSLKRIIVANAIRTIFIDLILNTYWMIVLYNYQLPVILPPRALKLLVMFPIETFMLYMLIKGVEASGILKGIQRENSKNRIKE